MATKEERDQHVAHVAFKITDFWPHDPTTWFRKIESKFRICNITQSSTKYDHLLSALPTEVCSNINNSLVEMDENAANAYEQLKGLLMSRYTKDRWARALELHKFPEIMKPTEMMRQIKALLPTDSNPGTYFMASFLLRLPSDMIDNIISEDFKDCTKMAEYADLLYRGGATQSPPSTQTMRRPSTPSLAVGTRRPRPTTGGGNAARRSAQGAAAGRPRARTRMTATSVIITLHMQARVPVDPRKRSSR
jgi:hypothetical protein